MLDNIADSLYAPGAEQDYLNDDHYSFSCRFPFVLNSILLNFGKEFGLSNLQHYLLDSHWKAAYEMVFRVKNAMPSTDIPDSIIYVYCMEALTTAFYEDPGEVGNNLPFTLTKSESATDPSFTPFNSEDPIAGIVKKIKKAAETGEYLSWEDFYEHLKHPVVSETLDTEKTTEILTSHREGKLDDVEQKATTSPTFAEEKTSSLNYFDEFKRLILGESDRFDEQNILDNFAEQVTWEEMNQILKSIPSEHHQKLIERLGRERLKQIAKYPFILKDIFAPLTTSNQILLINSLGAEHLQKLTNTHTVLADLLCKLNPESRLVFLQTLDEDKVMQLFALPSFLANAIKELHDSNRDDVVVDLLKFLGDEPLLRINQSQKDYNDRQITYQKFEPWVGTYDAYDFQRYFFELERLMKQGHYGHILHIAPFDDKNKKISITFSSSGEWTIVNPHLPNPFAMTSKNTDEIAQKIFSTLSPNNGIITLSTQFYAKSSSFVSDHYNFSSMQQDIADQQFSNSANSKLMQDAFKANDKQLCERLIESGVDFFSCKIDSSDDASNNLFNELCEKQAEYNIGKLKKEIYSTDWGNKYTGRPIFNPTKGIIEKVPTTVALEIDEINKAGKNGQSYYSTWKRIVELRQEAAKHNEDFTSFFRKRPAKEHYRAANDAIILPLKKAGPM